MTTITTRSGKGSPLTNNEVDANFTNLNDDKVEASGDSMTGDLSFGDNNKAIFGAGSDLQIYHDASNSYIYEAGTGDLVVMTNGAKIGLAKASPFEFMLEAETDGAVTLYYDNAAKLATTSTGIDVTGNIALSSAGARRIDISNTSLADTGEMVSLQWDDNADLTFQGRASDGTFKANWYRIEASASDGLADAHRFYTDSSVERMNITSTGIDVTGTVTASHLTLSDSFPVLKIEDSDGTNQKLEIVSSSGASFLTARNGSSHGTINLRRTDGTTTARTMQVQSSGDIAIYADDGTTKAFYWDASTSRLGLGTTSPSTPLHVSSASVEVARAESTGTSGSYLTFLDADTTAGQKAWIGADGDLFKFYSNNSTLNMTMTTDGNVGIGTTAPAEELHINASVPTIRLQDSDGTNQYSNIVHSNGLLFLYARNGSSYGTFNFVGDDGTTQSTFSQITENAIQQFHSSAWYIRNRYDGGSLNFGVETSAGALYYPIQLVGSSNIIKFENASGEIARFDANGRLGLGTTSPSALLHLKSNAPYITFEDDDNNQDWQIQATASFAIRDQSADQERMRIDSSGRVQVAKTSQVYTTVGVQLGNYSSNSIDNTTQFTHNNSGGTSVACTAPVSQSCITFHRQDTGAFMGHIRNDSSNSVSYFTSSDERLKENIVDAPSASDDIDAIQIRSFDWKADGSHQKYGVIAQELNNVMPSAVDMTQDENRHASVDLSKLVPMLVKEIQSLRARVAQLEGAN